MGLEEENRSADFFTHLSAAENGDAASQGVVARMYLQGRGTEKSYSEAVKWAKRSAEQNNPTGQLTVGEMHLWELGFKRNLNEAHEWFQKAGQQGAGKAQAYLGIMYLINVLSFRKYLNKTAPIKHFRMEAYYWFLLASRPGMNRRRVVAGKWASRLLVSKKEAAAIRGQIAAQKIKL